jgi:hypothetical protein
MITTPSLFEAYLITCNFYHYQLNSIHIWTSLDLKYFESCPPTPHIYQNSNTCIINKIWC